MSDTPSNPVMMRASPRFVSLASLGGMLARFLTLAPAAMGSNTARSIGGFSDYRPADWGVSPQCARLRRKNRMRRMGIGSDHR